MRNQRATFQYVSYRELLKDLYAKSREKDPQVTMEVIGKSLGWTDFSYFSRILSGARKLPLKKIPKVTEYFKLYGKEGIYFENLVRWNDFADAKGEKVCVGLQKKAEKKDITNHHTDNLTEFYEFILIRAALRRTAAPMTVQEIAAFLTKEMTIKQVEAALERMKPLGQVDDAGDGKYALPSNILRTVNDFPNEGVRHYHKKMIHKSLQGVDQPNPERQFTGRTICISKASLPELKNAMIELIDQFVDKYSDEKAEDRELYHFMFNGFSLEKILKKDES